MIISQIIPIIILIIVILSILNFLVIPRKLQVYVVSFLVSIGMLVFLVLYHLDPSTHVYSSIYSLSLACIWIIDYIVSYHVATKTMGKDAIVVNLTSVWVIAVIIGIFLDASGLYVRLGLNEDIAFWFFSAILQGFSALLGIVAAFSLIRFQISRAPTKIKHFQKILEPFFPHDNTHHYRVGNLYRLPSFLTCFECRKISIYTCYNYCCSYAFFYYSYY